MLSVSNNSGSATIFPSASSSSASNAVVMGYIAYLQEENVELKTYSIENLYKHVDSEWYQIAHVLPDIEALAESTSGPNNLQQTACMLASKVLYYLEEHESALRYAIQASTSSGVDNTEGKLAFLQEDDSPYAMSLTRAALDLYIQLKKKQDEATEPTVAAAASAAADGTTTTRSTGGSSGSVLTIGQLKPYLHQLLMASCNTGQLGVEHAIGMALETRELELLEPLLLSGGNSAKNNKILSYTMKHNEQIPIKCFRQQVWKVLAKSLEAQLQLQLQPSHQQGQDEHTDGDNNNNVAYDLVWIYQNLKDPQAVADVLKKLDPLTALQVVLDLQDTGDQAFVQSVSDRLELENTPSRDSSSIVKVLKGGFLSELALSFLHKNSNADNFIMTDLKNKLENNRSSSSTILHNAAVVTHSYLYAGTTNDSFLRNHLDWMKKASHWAKFTATASLGVVHASHVTEAMHLLEPYLPPSSSTSGGEVTVTPTGGYSEGGSLYALGLIHGSHSGTSVEQRQIAQTYLREHLCNSHANEAMSHGAALAVGLTAMGSANLEIVQELKEVLDTDSAVAGEAAGMAIGMVLAGTGGGDLEVVTDLRNYSKDTQHEKIIRGIAMGLAMMQFGQEENADVFIEEMRSDRDPILRYGAQYAIALAYAGTGSNKAIRILLHTAVSDVSDDVRMAAVVGLAFVLYKTPQRVPELVQLLLESFNPHVRYASCMAVGIAMAGTGDSHCVSMLEPMLEDMTDYVRQGALMGTAMIYMQQSDLANGRKIRSFREKLTTLISEKHQSTLTKMGAILSVGILDAGGRNCSLQLGSRNGFTKMSSTIGLALWLQHWHWYPMFHMFSLALTPTLTIGLNKDLKYPKNFAITCNSKPSVFAYPKKIEEKKEKEKKRVETVTLSITAKEKARLARKKAKLGETDTMDVDEKEEEKPKDEDAMDVEEEKPRKKREPEPTSFKLANPSRITLVQSKLCEFDLGQRYHPIRPKEKPFGVFVLTDSTPNLDDEELQNVKPPSFEPEGETAPPEPFEWTPPPRPSSNSNKDEEASKESSD